MWGSMWNGWNLNTMMGWPRFGGALVLFSLWSLFWKGLALWKSARGDQRYWFIALLLINTVGILEMVYLFAFAKDKLTLSKTTVTANEMKSKRNAKKKR